MPKTLSTTEHKSGIESNKHKRGLTGNKNPMLNDGFHCLINLYVLELLDFIKVIK